MSSAKSWTLYRVCSVRGKMCPFYLGLNVLSNKPTEVATMYGQCIDLILVNITPDQDQVKILAHSLRLEPFSLYVLNHFVVAWKCICIWYHLLSILRACSQKTLINFGSANGL